MHILLTGATGLVGTGVLSYLLSTPSSISRVTRLTVLSRRPVPMLDDFGRSRPQNASDGKPDVKIIQHSDFAHYPEELLRELKEGEGVKGVVWALGVSMNDVNKEEYVKITKTWALAAAKAFGTLPDGEGEGKVNFVYVSGEGATTTSGRFTPLFGRVKGETEQELLALGKQEGGGLNVYSVRAGAVDLGQDPETMKWQAEKRKEKLLLRFGDAVLFPLFRRGWPGLLTPTKELGKLLTELAVGDGEALEGKGIEGEGRTIKNVAIRRMVGL